MPQLTQKAKKPPKAHSSKHMHGKGVARPPFFLRDVVLRAPVYVRSRAFVRVRSCVRSSPHVLAHVRLCSLLRADGLFRKNARFSPKYARACVAKRPELAQRCPLCTKPQVVSLGLVRLQRVANVPLLPPAYFGEKSEEISRNVSRSRKEAAFANRDARQHAHRIAMLVLMMTASAFRVPTRAPNQVRTQKGPRRIRCGPWLQKRSARAGASSGSRR